MSALLLHSSRGTHCCRNGGAGAIGGAIVVALEEDGQRVLILDRDEVDLADADAVAAVAARIGSCDVFVQADIAGAVAFLASDRAAAITGQTICVDGGLVFR